MRLPVKISPDSIKDSIIEVKYVSPIPFEILVGFIYNALDESYSYTNQPKQVKQNLNEITFNIGGLNLFYTDKLKIQLQQNSIIFNCTDGYIGWADYKAEIEKALKQISTIKEIEFFERIGVRYISEYPEKDIKEVTRFSFEFGIQEIQSDTFIFRTEFVWDNYKIHLTLQHKSPILSPIDKGTTFQLKQVSIIDVDVISDGLKINDIQILFDKIEETHSKEKEVFFRILKEEFIQSLNPIY